MTGIKDEREVTLLYELLLEKYGDKMVEAELEDVKKIVEGIVEAAASVRAVKLESWWEPSTIFKPYRGG